MPSSATPDLTSSIRNGGRGIPDTLVAVDSGEARSMGTPPGRFDRTDRSIYLKLVQQQSVESKDLGRSLDYLEMRKDIDASKLRTWVPVWEGSRHQLWGAVDNRIKVMVVSSVGFRFRRDLPEVDPLNFAPHVTNPVLMISGRYDQDFPSEFSQLPLFHSLGTPAKDKKQVIYEGGHGVFPHPDAIRECLNWLDKYLGPVQH